MLLMNYSIILNINTYTHGQNILSNSCPFVISKRHVYCSNFCAFYYILFLEGYKSYSHEASISYLSKLGFSISEVTSIDRLRRQRNGIKYYGEDSTKEESAVALKIAEEIIKKLLHKKPELKCKLLRAKAPQRLIEI